jgi:FAD/FMN-containing dehydrogenase
MSKPLLQLPDAFLVELRSALGEVNVKTGEAIALLDPGVRADNLGGSAVVFPTTTEDVVAVVKAAAKWRVPIVPHGGRTGLVGGGLSKPGEVVIATNRMNRIERLDPIENAAVVQSGVVLQSLQEAAAGHGLSPGIDTPARGSATIGGMMSTNAGGIMAFRNGVMRHRVLGIEAVLADGSVYRDLTRIVKNSAGYDLKHLLIGAEGTLGVVTRAVLKLEPLPAATATALFGLPSTAMALKALRRGLAAQVGHLRGAEVMWTKFINFTAACFNWSAPDYDLSAPAHLILSLGGADESELQGELAEIYAELAETGEPISAVVATSAAQEAEIWRLREATQEVSRVYPAIPSYDVSVPLSEIEGYLTRVLAGLKRIAPDLDPFVFGHLGDGNLHILINRVGVDVPPDVTAAIEEVLYAGIRELGGSFSAEHGVGSKRIHSLNATADPVKLELMRQIKERLDPDNILNPGKLFYTG